MAQVLVPAHMSMCAVKRETLNEIVLDDMTNRHRQELNRAGSQLPQHDAEMEIMTNALLAAAEIAAIGRQILSGKNEQIGDDLSAIKESVDRVAQQIADGAMADDRDLHGRIESMTASVVAAAQTVKGVKSVLHKQNEDFLMSRIKEITAAVQQLKDMEGVMQFAADKHIESIVRPVVLLRAS